MNELRAACEHFSRHRGTSDDREVLTALLYDSWYARPQKSVEVPVGYPSDLVEILRAADTTGRSWEDGWVVDRVRADGEVIARRNGAVRMARICEYVAPGAIGVIPRPGDVVCMAGRRDRIDPDGTWWRTGGRAWRFSRTLPGLVRIYWNVGLADLPTLVTLITGALDSHEGPWMLKCAVERSVHRRADAVVLFITRSGLEQLAGNIDAIAALVATHQGTPPLTLEIHAGVAVAFDPGDGDSFGMRRCRLVVEALLNGGGATPSGLHAIAERFDAAGIDVHRPFAVRGDVELPWER